MRFDRSRLRRGEWIVGAWAACCCAGASMLGACRVVRRTADRRARSTGWNGLTHLRWLAAGHDRAVALALVFFQATRRAPALPVSFSRVRHGARRVTALWLIYRVLISPAGRQPRARRDASALAQRARDRRTAATSSMRRGGNRAQATPRGRSATVEPRAARPRRPRIAPDARPRPGTARRPARAARAERRRGRADGARSCRKVLDHVEKIRELDLEGVPPTSHVVDVVERAAGRRAASRACRSSGAGQAPEPGLPTGRLRRAQPRASAR